MPGSGRSFCCPPESLNQCLGPPGRLFTPWCGGSVGLGVEQLASGQVKSNICFHQMPKLRMSGAVPLYVFMAWTGRPFYKTVLVTSQTCRSVDGICVVSVW